MKQNQRLTLLVCLGMVMILWAAAPAWAGSQAKNQFYLVSTGVGDPDLITLRAINTIKASDVVICRKRTNEALAEYLKGKTILDAAKAGWRRFRKDCTTVSDPEKRAECEKYAKLHAELVKEIRTAVEAGKTVSVLGGGDMMIYGGPYRWYLKEFKDLNPKVIPGVSCFNAANAAIGQDIMMGTGSRSAVLTTFRGIDDLAGSHPTMVLFTMHTKFKDLVGKLKEHYPEDTPIAIVFHAGYKSKEYIEKGTLSTIIDQTKDAAFPFEHLVYVGDFMK